PGFLFQGNNLRINHLADGRGLDNEAKGVAANCGWGWGAQFGDLDRDGAPDLYVLNGFRSASKDKDWWYGMQKIGGGLSQAFEDAANWPPFDPERSLSGFEQSRVLLNDGRGNFHDVASAAGATDLLDGRAVCLADLFGDGALDVVIANQEGPVLLYRNEVDPARHWIGFDLGGRAPTTRAIGAALVLHYGGKAQRQTVMAGSGFCSQNGHVLIFGLGALDAVESAEVLWPDGHRSAPRGLEVDRV